MRDTANRWRTGIRRGALLGFSALVPVACLWPVAMQLSGGIDTPRSIALLVLLLEVAYLLVTSTLLGIFCTGTGDLAPSSLVPFLLTVSLLTVSLLAGSDPSSIAGAQPAALCVCLLGIGAGKASLHACRRFAPATATAFLIVLAMGGNVLVVSHLAPVLSSRPWASGILLSLNPFIVVTGGGGFDLIRSTGLYDVLSLAGYRFQYPHPVLGPLLMTSAGLAMGILAYIKFPPVTRR
jgi:hypothetical protein